MTLPPLSAISVIAGAARSMRVEFSDDAVLHRHIEVNAHQDAFPLYVNVVEGAETAQDVDPEWPSEGGE